MLGDEELDYSILAAIGNAIAWIFTPLGWGSWQATVASITGLVAKENIVGTMGILYGGGDGTVYQNIAAAFTGISAYSLPGVQPAVCALLRGYRSNKARDEQPQVDMVCNSLSVRIRLCDSFDDKPVRQRRNRSYQCCWPDVRHCGARRDNLHACQAL